MANQGVRKGSTARSPACILLVNDIKCDTMIPGEEFQSASRARRLEIEVVNVIVIVGTIVVEKVVSVLLLLHILLRALLVDSVKQKRKQGVSAQGQTTSDKTT